MAADRYDIAIVGVSRSPDGVFRLTWTSNVGRSYRVLYKRSLSDPAWEPLTTVLVANAATTSWSDAPGIAAPQRFYRVMEF